MQQKKTLLLFLNNIKINFFKELFTRNISYLKNRESCSSLYIYIPYCTIVYLIKIITREINLLFLKYIKLSVIKHLETHFLCYVLFTVKESTLN